MQKLELLAPAKNLECGKAAIDHGADAVYIGAQRFGARASAGNSTEDIAELCRYAHTFGAKVFVTVNTIIYDEELDDTLALIDELDSIGVDALLVQDMGLYSILREKQLHCHLHASTQTDNRTAEKVRWLSSIGFRRVVLARELSIEEIAEIHRGVPDVELEVFVHGALCVSYSGQCYASEHCFHRSANRGECAQFCRLAFTLMDANDRIIESDRHLLSLKDMAQLNNLERLAEAGAVSFKIEGRLKDVDYVKNVTSAYSEELNRIVAAHPEKYCRASFGRCRYTYKPDIAKSFNRGFTTYFADGRQQSLVSFDTPKAMGEYVGKVKELRGNSFNVAGTANFANGDGLCFLDGKRELIGFRVNRVEGNRIFPLRMPQGIRPGTQLFRNFDKAFNDILTRESSERKMDIDFSFTTSGNTMILEATDECGRKYQASCECNLSVAQKPQEENIRKVLSKLGDTPFVCRNVCISTKDFIPSSMLANLRREVIEGILSQNIVHETSASAINETPIPHYPTPYLYNAANKQAQEFYKERGINDACSFEKQAWKGADSFEKRVSNGAEDNHNGRTLLMQCRYCLRNEMGYCTKNGRKAPWKEPLRLCLPDGKEFLLQFDCKNCQMNMLSPLSL